MRHHYKKPYNYIPIYGQTYKCNHYLYTYCTLYLHKNRGIAVIQQHYNEKLKTIRWSELDPWLANDIYLNINFKKFFDEYSSNSINGIYPTIAVRKLMWILKMKPLKREMWEDSQYFHFD